MFVLGTRVQLRNQRGTLEGYLDFAKAIHEVGIKWHVPADVLQVCVALVAYLQLVQRQTVISFSIEILDVHEQKDLEK